MEINAQFFKVVGNSPLNAVGQYHHAIDPHLVLMDAVNDLRKVKSSTNQSTNQS